MATKTVESRCFVCGKTFNAGDEVRSVSDTRYGNSTSKLWGTSHTDCFERSVDTPSVMLDRLKRMDKKLSKAKPA